MEEHFGDVLDEYIRNRNRTPGQLESLSEVPRQTIISWRKGLVKRPRSILDILRVAQALHLDRNEVNRLLCAARHYPIEQLAEQGHGEDSAAVAEILDFWLKNLMPVPPTIIDTHPPPFSAPRPTHYFVGRDALIRQVKTALRQGEICALWGMGGIGKSELAKTLVNLLRNDFPHGVLWADMRRNSTNNTVDQVRLREILGNWLTLCGRPVGGEGDEAESLDGRSAILRTMLSQRQMLLVLDNVHKSEEIEPFLPPQGSSSALLITTRDRRSGRRYGQLFEVPPLNEDECQQLIQRYLGCKRVHDEQENVAALAQLLEGHPLALSVVSSDLEESQELTIRDYIELLQGTVSLRRTRATIEISYRHLPAELQTIFLLLPLFEESDFDSSAVAAAANEPLLQIKQKLSHLCALTLVEEVRYAHDEHLIKTNEKTTEASDVQIRYRLHSLMRLFALEKGQEERQEINGSGARLADHYFQLVEEQRVYPFGGLHQDFEHILRALAWLSQQKRWDLYRKTVNSLTTIQLGLVGFLDSRGHWSMAIELLHPCLQDNALTAKPQDLAEIYLKMALFYERQGKQVEASTHLGSAEKAMTLPSTSLTKHRLWPYCYQLRARLNPAEALIWSNKALEQIRQNKTARDRHEEGYFLIWHGSVLGRRGELDSAKEATQAGLALLPPEANAARINGLNVLGILHELSGDSRAAIASWQEAMPSAKAVGDLRREGMLWSNIGAAESRRGRLQAAIVNKQVALDRYRAVGFLSGQARTLSNLGEDYTLLLDFAAAQRHLAEAESLARAHALLPELQWALLNKVQFMLERGDDLHEIETLHNEATELQEQLNGQRPGIICQRLAAELALQRKRMAEALALAEALVKAAENEPVEDGLAYRLLGKIYSHIGNTDAAQDAYQQSEARLAGTNP